MKFPGFKEFDTRIGTLTEVIAYLRSEHSLNLKELVTGLRRLSFLDNFDAFRVTVTIPAGAEVGIENKLRGSIPTDRYLTRGNGAEIIDGGSAWTATHVFLKNSGASDATVTVIFFK